VPSFKDFDKPASNFVRFLREWPTSRMTYTRIWKSKLTYSHTQLSLIPQIERSLPRIVVMPLVYFYNIFKSCKPQFLVLQKFCSLYYITSLYVTLSQNYSTHSYGFLVSTATTLVVSTLLLVITTRPGLSEILKLQKCWKQYKHIFILNNHTSILILLRLHMFLLQK
jgi:hypothetical protein